ncbi:MAG: major facilitator superfamily transporter [Acidobacteriaceae bacterium]|jgi:DHA3 family macrolide efflux protein-like MFS transporter|nr:major facilitator superfamily transporter [Acidobacteriaceae bacterium]
MRSILQKKGLRFIFAANVISMIGSGMNSAAVAWYILQATHSEIALGTFAVVQTLPAILLLPFTGVIIDREDRRRLVMVLDAARALVIAAVAVLAFQGKAKVWELYAMNMLVAAGFWMFWPTITALIQEMTPDDEFIHANTFLLAGVQGGWLIAGALVGFVYNKIGLGGVLLLDVSSYVLSFLCYFAVRKGRHVVPRPAELHADIVAAESAVQKFFRELRDGVQFLRGHREIVMLGISWALFLSAMMTGVVVTPPLSEYFHAGAVGYGWLNGGWGVGAFASAFYAPMFIKKFGARRSIAISLGLLAILMTSAPTMPFLALAVVVYALMGSGRGITGVAMNTSMMERIPQHFMGRVQNTFYFAGTLLQVLQSYLVGAVAQRNLIAGFSVIGFVYAAGFITATWPMRTTQPMELTQAE